MSISGGNGSALHGTGLASGMARDVWLLGTTTAFIASGFLGMTQLLKTLYVLRLGFGAEYVGVMFALGAGAFALASIPAGMAGARWGAKRAMLIGAAINLSAMCILPLTESVPASLRYIWPLLFQSIAPVGWAMVVVNQMPAIMSLTTARNRKAAYGLREALSGMGMFLGAFIGGLLPGAFADLMNLPATSPTPYSYALWVAVAVVACGLAPLALTKPAPFIAPPRLDRRSAPPLAPLLLIGACGFLNNAGLAACRAFAPAYLDQVFGLPTSLIGALTSMGLLAAVFAALSSGRLARGGNSAFGMMISSWALACFLLLIGAVPQWLAAGAGMIGSLAVMSVWMPSAQVVQMELVPAEWRALASGLVSMTTSLGFASMSLAGGYIAKNYSYPPLFLVAALLALLGGLLAVRLVRRRPAR